jgi:phage gpG-like protein
MIELKVKDPEINAIASRIRDMGGDLKPAMRDVGELLVRSTKKRFADGRGPDGTFWPSNTQATLETLMRRKAGGTVRRKGEKIKRPYARKDGRLNKRGAQVMMGKKPLIGESKRLGDEIHYAASDSGVEVGSPMEYAAVQQFGAGKGEFGRTKRGAPIPWGDIPARPFLGLSDVDKLMVMDILNDHLAAAVQR